MAFSFSGEIGGGVQDALAEMLKERILQEQIAAQKQQQEFENTFRLQDFGERSQTNRARLDMDAKRLEQDDRERRDRANQEGLREMHAQRGFMDRDEQQRRVLDMISRIPTESGKLQAGLGAEGVSVGEDAVTSPEERQQRTVIDLQRIGQEADIRNRSVARFREGPSPEWVTDAQGDVVKRRPQPGDKPYDAVAARKQPAEGPSAYSTERGARTIQSVDNLIKKVSRKTTGFGSLLSGIPESGARDFAAQIETLKANVGFNELTAMREASKTGGALGNVSNVELGLLTSALGALDTGQSPENMLEQLQQIKDSVLRFNQALAGGASGGGSGAADPLGIRKK